jgi:hypothetical protein
MKDRVAAISSASAVEAVEADIEAGRIILDRQPRGEHSISLLTIESKHCVQSSRYTDWFGPGGRSSVDM